MKQDWQELTNLTQGEDLIVERVRLKKRDITIEGQFELPPLGRLSAEDQIFIIAFIRSHGSIKDMEELYGVSYPTVKNRLKRITQLLEFVEVNPPPAKGDVLDRLRRGEMNVDEAVKKIKGDG